MLQQARGRVSTRHSNARDRFLVLHFRQGTRLENHQCVTVLKSLVQDVTYLSYCSSSCAVEPLHTGILHLAAAGRPNPARSVML